MCQWDLLLIDPRISIILIAYLPREYATMSLGNAFLQKPLISSRPDIYFIPMIEYKWMKIEIRNGK